MKRHAGCNGNWAAQGQSGEPAQSDAVEAGETEHVWGSPRADAMVGEPALQPTAVKQGERIEAICKKCPIEHN